MAFNINPGKQQFSATAAQTVFTFNFAIFADTDLKVYKTLAGAVADDTADLLTLSTHYTVSINGTLGGTVTLLSGASLNDTITIVRVLPVTRTTDYVTNGDLYADTLDLDQDYQTYLVQDGYVQLERAIILPESSGGIDVNIPAPVANSYLRWNATADALENDTSIPDDVVTTTNNVALTNADVVLTHADVVLTNADVVLAHKWATELEDVVVTGGEFSAYHWAKKALSYYASLVFDAVPTDGSTNGVESNGVFDALATKAPLHAPTFTGTVEVDNYGFLQFNNVSTFATILNAIAPTADRNIQFPDASGTIALLSDITSASSILAEFEVTGSAVTSIDFSGLDINLHGGSYEIELRLVNATASSAIIYGYVNGDTTLTNYYSEYLVANGTGFTASRVNSPQVAQLLASLTTGSTIDMSLINGYMHGTYLSNYGRSTNLQLIPGCLNKTATVANITQLTFVSSVALSIDIGSKIIIRRKDV